MRETETCRNGNVRTFQQPASFRSTDDDLARDPARSCEQFATDYGVMVLPHMFLVNREGKVVSRTIQVGNVEEEIKKLNRSCAQAQDAMKAIRENMQLLTKLEGYATASTTHATEKGKLDSDQAITLAKYLMEGRTERAKEMVTLTQAGQVLTEQLDFAQRCDGGTVALIPRPDRKKAEHTALSFEVADIDSEIKDLERRGFVRRAIGLFLSGARGESRTRSTPAAR